jgi:hypothetical protein
MERALASTTRLAYQHGWHVFQTFILQQGSKSLHLLSSQAREALLCLFVTHCAVYLKVSYGTIKTYLSGASITVFVVTLVNPLVHLNGHPFLKLHTHLKVLKTVSSSIRSPRLPVTVSILRNVVSVHKRGIFGHYFDKLLICAFALALLSSGVGTSPHLPYSLIHKWVCHVKMSPSNSWRVKKQCWSTYRPPRRTPSARV